MLTSEPVQVGEVSSHKGNYEAYYNLIITLDNRFDRYVVVTNAAMAGCFRLDGMLQLNSEHL